MPYITCPKCNDESYFSMSTYKGPFRCMKCKGNFNIVIENGELKSIQPVTQQDVDKLNLRARYK